MFAVRTKPSPTALCSVEGNWLFACDADKRGYRLPLPNLHDDCRICTGAFDDLGNGRRCVTASLEQFRKSKWNADLMRTSEQSQKFFRFQPTKETFETLPIQADDWTTLCDKVGHAPSWKGSSYDHAAKAKVPCAGATLEVCPTLDTGSAQKLLHETWSAFSRPTRNTGMK